MNNIRGIHHVIEIFNEARSESFVEGITFRQSKFGMNIPKFDDAKIASSSEKVLFSKYKNGFGKNSHYTFFEDNGMFVLVYIFKSTANSYELSFATTDYRPDNNDIEDYMTHFSVEQTTSASAFSIFGKVMYIASIVAQTMKITSFKIRSTELTSSLYDRMKTNTNFKRTIESYGWKMTPLEDGFKVKRR